MTHETLDSAASKFYFKLDGYAPTIGIIDAVLALIVVLGDLSDPNQGGAGHRDSVLRNGLRAAFSEFDFLTLRLRSS